MKHIQKNTPNEAIYETQTMPATKARLLYFSQNGYNNHVRRIQEADAEIARIKSGTNDAHESEGGSQEESAIHVNINDAIVSYENISRTLNKELENFKIIQYPTSVDSVCVGCIAKIRVDNNKETQCYIVGYGENGNYKNSIKYDAPIAKALMKQKPGFKGGFNTEDDKYRTVELLGVSPIKEK